MPTTSNTSQNKSGIPLIHVDGFIKLLGKVYSLSNYTMNIYMRKRLNKEHEAEVEAQKTGSD